MSQKKMFEIICHDCKKASTVPFEPRKDKPVYCKTCLQKRRPKRPVRPSEPITFNLNNAWARRGNNSKQRKTIKKSVFQQ